MSVRLLSACRSAVAPSGGALAALDLHDLAAPVLRAALRTAGCAAEEVDELVVSNALGAGGNPARSVALAAGLPQRVAGLSIDRQCAGGIDAILLGARLIESGAARVVVAGGVESHSRRPLRARTFADGRPPAPYEQARFTPWADRDPGMAEAAAALAQAQGITRAEQDAWAVESHARARAADRAEGEVVAVAGCDRDPFTRALSAAVCARAPVLQGTVTAATTAVAADGAAFCVLASAAVAGGRGLRLLGGATLGHLPDQPGLSPLPAIAAALGHAGLAARDLAAVEIMEAYAVQAIACVRGAGVDPARVNRGGGALARGHPIGASGTINAVRLFHTLRATGGTGLAAIAGAGGVGSALVLGA